MPDVTVPALKAFTYREQSVSRGDMVTMSALDAAVHARRGLVSLARGYQTRAIHDCPNAEGIEGPQGEDGRRPKRRYRRRDMEAERG